MRFCVAISISARAISTSGLFSISARFYSISLPDSAPTFLLDVYRQTFLDFSCSRFLLEDFSSISAAAEAKHFLSSDVTERHFLLVIQIMLHYFVV